MELERELQSTMDHERMMGEIHENLVAKYSGNAGRVGAGDVFGSPYDREPVYHAPADERPTRDPGFNHRSPAHAPPP